MYKSIFDFSSFMWLLNNSHRILESKQEKELMELIRDVKNIKV